MFKHFFHSIFIFISTLSLFVVANAITVTDFNEKQVVYLADEPLFQIATRLKEQGMSEDEVLEYLKNTLPILTPELAKEKFDIKWIDNNLPEIFKQNFYDMFYDITKIETRNTHGYPTVAVCYMESDDKYSLFAMTNIEVGDFIAEHTGKHIKDPSLIKPSPYIVEIRNNDDLVGAIDASSSGNAARFIKPLITEKELNNYKYILNGEELTSDHEIATSNCEIIPNGSQVAIIAMKEIKIFEQIGISYEYDAGYSSSLFHKEIHLFNKAGKIIPKETYKTLYKSILFYDEDSAKTISIQLIPTYNLYITTEIMHELFSDIKYVDGCFADHRYIVLKYEEKEEEDDNLNIIVNERTYKEKILSSDSRISIPAYIIDNNINIDEFISLLEQIYDLDEQLKRDILFSARENDLDKAYESLHHLTGKPINHDDMKISFEGGDTHLATIASPNKSCIPYRKFKPSDLTSYFLTQFDEKIKEDFYLYAWFRSQSKFAQAAEIALFLLGTYFVHNKLSSWHGDFISPNKATLRKTPRGSGGGKISPRKPPNSNTNTRATIFTRRTERPHPLPGKQTELTRENVILLKLISEIKKMIRKEKNECEEFYIAANQHYIDLIDEFRNKLNKHGVTKFRISDGEKYRILGAISHIEKKLKNKRGQVST